MGHKPWDRPWKRREKAKAKRAWRAEIDLTEDELVRMWDEAEPADVRGVTKPVSSSATIHPSPFILPYNNGTAGTATHS